MKKGLLYVLAVPTLIWGITSCVGVKTDVNQLNGKWTITEVKGEKVSQGKKPYLEFNMSEKKISGNAGCNSFTSNIKLDAHNISGITIAPAAATMMACPDMEWEGKVFKAFEEVQSVKKGDSKDEMLLMDKDNKVLLALEKSNE